MSGHPKYFKKPWASTALMFVAMVLCLPIAWIAAAIEAHRKESAASSERKPLLGEEGETSTEQGKRDSAHSPKAQCPSGLYGIVRISAKILCSLAGATAKLAAKSATFKEIMILGLPMAFDLTATLLMSIGLL